MRHLRWLLIVLCLFLVAGACGDDDEETTGGDTTEEESEGGDKASGALPVVATDFSFAGLSESVEGGTVAIELENQGKEPHELQLVQVDEGSTFEQFKKDVLGGDGAPLPKYMKDVGGGVGAIP